MLAVKKWPMEDVWLYAIKEMLTLNKMKECGKILSLIGLDVAAFLFV